MPDRRPDKVAADGRRTIAVNLRLATRRDVPIYEEFFRAVREVNAKLPKKRKLRVLLGDLPIDWDQIKTQEDLRKAVRSDTVPAEIIEREVIAKGRRALVLYGDMHSVRRSGVHADADWAHDAQRWTK